MFSALHISRFSGLFRRSYSNGRPFPKIKQTSTEFSKEPHEMYKKVKKLCLGGGGEKGIFRHVKVNKKVVVRERIQKLLDHDGNFLELGLLAGIDMDYGDVPCAGIVAGIGKIHGNYCMIVANDATVKGGTYFPISVVKSLRCQKMAQNLRIPCIYLVDSGGAFLPLQSEIFPDKHHGGRSFYNQAIMNSLGIPQIALVCGSCTAGAAYCPTMSQETIITQRIGTIFLGGPPLVKAALGEVVTEEELGGAMLHSQTSGCTDYFAASEDESFEICRDIVAALNLQPVQSSTAEQEPLYSQESLAGLGGKEPLGRSGLYFLLSRILDGGRFREFKEKFADKLVTGYGYICGDLVGIVASHGRLTSKDALKGSHFIQLAEQRNIPILFLNGGDGSREDPQDGYSLIKDRAKMAATVATSTIPKISINLRVSCDDDHLTMCGPGFEPSFNFAWPFSEFHMDMEWSALHLASHCVIDGVIEPENTRQTVVECLRIVRQGQQMSPLIWNSPVLRM